MMSSALQAVILLSLLITLPFDWAQGEEITLKCDEFERLYDIVAGEPFCTVSGFIVSHSQNVKIQKYTKANMTKFMKFYDSRLLYVPYKLFDVFSNLKTLDVSFTEILDVPRNTFGAANNLTYLNMSHNNITQITTSVFMGANNLMRLDLSRNKIAEINEFAFRGLINLDKLQLSYNQLQKINQNVFVENLYVESIALDNNLIEYIEPEVFNRLRRIRDVNLSNNRISHIHPQSFQAAYGMERLILSSNRLSEFHLANKSIAAQLNLDHNYLTSISINGTKYVRGDHNNISEITMINAVFLESLELSTNNMSNIMNITNLTGLLELDLSFNPIDPLNITTFNRLKRLRSLYLRATGIRQLTFGMFSKQNDLELLDLAFNNLTELNLDIFVPYLSNLKQFFVDGNNLTEIQGKRSFSHCFPNLQKLGVSRNRFNCSYLHAMLIPPQLSATVTLQIEPDNSDVETSHIRDVSCISNVKQSLNHVRQELADISELQRLLQQSMETLRLHEKNLEVYLLVLKIALFAIICLVLVVAVVRFWKFKRTNYFAQRGNSIVFHSNATVNTNMDH